MNQPPNRHNRPGRGRRPHRHGRPPNQHNNNNQGNRQHPQHQGNRQHHPNQHGGHNASPAQAFDLERLFRGKTPIAPKEWIRLEKGSDDLSMRAVDLLSPVGKGQRGLIVAPPKAGKTTLLRQFACTAAQASPGLKVYCLLIDERPEEVTEFRRGVPAEVFASSNDRDYDEHIRLAEKVFTRAAEEAAKGEDVLILLDSLTRLARVHNARATGTRTMTGGLDARAMELPRRFFGAARKLEEGGSLTILATILVETGSRMDDVIFQEFKGTGNMELVLSRQAAENRVFPAINVKASGTRREEALFPPTMLDGVWKMRRALAPMNDLEASKKVVEMLKQHKSNEALLQTFM